jgi:hypothetical protein
MTKEVEVTKESASEPAGSKTSDVQTGDSDRGLVPDSEEAQARWFRGLVKRLDDEHTKAEYDGEEEVVKDAENRLVKHFQSTFRFYIYWRIGPIMAGSVAIGLLTNWFVQPVPIEAYGLVANLVGTVILTVTTTRGRFMIANSSLPEQERAEVLRESYARQTAVTTAGLGAFLLGFGIQLVGVLL